ncbi:DUF3037 domain-containing protein [Sorangium sp. So ce1036]|uniref:DUF3037 domain-containing protein n=1 Tax=Sorangium sp. So ce1036 TaxID=3133328 RepID=UPI003F054EBC
MPEPDASPPRAGGAREAFDYAVLRVVPRVERGERMNVGVILFCRAQGFLDARAELDARRLLALAPDLDLEAVGHHLDFVRRVCAGDPACGFVAGLPQAERFGWLVSPASTIVQPSRVHAGLSADPAAALERLLAELVRLG